MFELVFSVSVIWGRCNHDEVPKMITLYLQLKQLKDNIAAKDV